MIELTDSSDDDSNIRTTKRRKTNIVLSENDESQADYGASKFNGMDIDAFEDDHHGHTPFDPIEDEDFDALMALQSSLESTSISRFNPRSTPECSAGAGPSGLSSHEKEKIAASSRFWSPMLLDPIDDEMSVDGEMYSVSHTSFVPYSLTPPPPGQRPLTPTQFATQVTPNPHPTCASQVMDVVSPPVSTRWDRYVDNLSTPGASSAGDDTSYAYDHSSPDDFSAPIAVPRHRMPVRGLAQPTRRRP